MSDEELTKNLIRDLCGPTVIFCKDCKYYKPFKNADGYGECQSNHTFDGAFRDNDYCSYAKQKDAK